MSAANGNPLHPASLAANGLKGAGATLVGLHVTERSGNDDSGADARVACFHALLAVTTAQARLDNAARSTDRPPWQLVEAADLLDAAQVSLLSAVES